MHVMLTECFTHSTVLTAELKLAARKYGYFPERTLSMWQGTRMHSHRLELHAIVVFTTNRRSVMVIMADAFGTYHKTPEKETTKIKCNMQIYLEWLMAMA